MASQLSLCFESTKRTSYETSVVPFPAAPRHQAAAQKEYQRAIQEAEAALGKIEESQATLLAVLLQESAELGRRTGTAALKSAAP